jgi:hypothetical protein
MATSDERNRRARTLAAMRREGKTWAQIGAMMGMSGEAIRQAIARGCPPFHGPEIEEPRPEWSYPDRVTLALVHQIKREMERGR